MPFFPRQLSLDGMSVKLYLYRVVRAGQSNSVTSLEEDAHHGRIEEQPDLLLAENDILGDLLHMRQVFTNAAKGGVSGRVAKASKIPVSEQLEQLDYALQGFCSVCDLAFRTNSPEVQLLCCLCYNLVHKHHCGVVEVEGTVYHLCFSCGGAFLNNRNSIFIKTYFGETYLSAVTEWASFLSKLMTGPCSLKHFLFDGGDQGPLAGFDYLATPTMSAYIVRNIAERTIIELGDWFTPVDSSGGDFVCSCSQSVPLESIRYVITGFKVSGLEEHGNKIVISTFAGVDIRVTPPEYLCEHGPLVFPSLWPNEWAKPQAAATLLGEPPVKSARELALQKYFKQMKSMSMVRTLRKRRQTPAEECASASSERVEGEDVEASSAAMPALENEQEGPSKRGRSSNRGGRAGRTTGRGRGRDTTDEVMAAGARKKEVTALKKELERNERKVAAAANAAESMAKKLAASSEDNKASRQSLRAMELKLSELQV
jgi:hypothetical protein